MDYTEQELQDIFFDYTVSWEVKQSLKHLLPTKKHSEVSFYEQDGEPKFNVGDLLMDGDGKTWLIVED